MPCDRCDGRGWIVVPDGGAGSAARCECRQEAAAIKRLEACQVPPRYRECTIEGFRTAQPDKIVAQQLLQAKTMAQRWVDSYLSLEQQGQPRPTGLIFVGPPGAGKTHLATAILQEVVKRHAASGLFVDFTSFIARVQATYDPGAEETTREVMDRPSTVDLLVLDELGAQKPTDHTMEKLYLVMNARYTRNLPTIFTTNYRLDPDETQVDLTSLRARVAAPLIDRLFEMAHPVSMGGWSYRRSVRRHSTAP